MPFLLTLSTVNTSLNTLTHLIPLVSICTPGKHLKTFDFGIFGGHRKRPVAGNGLRKMLDFFK